MCLFKLPPQRLVNRRAAPKRQLAKVDSDTPLNSSDPTCNNCTGIPIRPWVGHPNTNTPALLAHQVTLTLRIKVQNFSPSRILDERWGGVKTVEGKEMPVYDIGFFIENANYIARGAAVVNLLDRAAEANQFIPATR